MASSSSNTAPAFTSPHYTTARTDSQQKGKGRAANIATKAPVPLSPQTTAPPIAATKIIFAEDSTDEEYLASSALQSDDEASPFQSPPNSYRSYTDSNTSPTAALGSHSFSMSPNSASPLDRRVSFHSSANISPTQIRHPNPLPQNEEHHIESDAEDGEGDENTAILTNPKDGGRRYETQGARQSQNTAKSSGADGSGTKRGQGTVRRKSSKPNGSAAQNDDEDNTSWWKRAIEKYGSVELENKGSVARDHLALERTFLAWLRTSLSFASIGIAVTQLFRLNTSLQSSTQSKEANFTPPTSGQTPIDVSVKAADTTSHLTHVGRPLGATFLAIGIVTLLIGFHRYFESQHHVIRGKFPASRGSVILVAAMSSAIIIASFVVVLTITPRHTAGTS